MYGIVSIIGSILRQVYLPNPFVNVFATQGIADLFNLVVGGAIIGGVIATVLAFTSFYKYMLAIVFVIFGIWAGNYIQKNKEMVKEKLKNFIDKL